MTDFIQRNRQEYIVNNGVFGNKNDRQVYIEGNKQKIELDRKLDEISTQSNLIVSGNAINRNVINSSASSRTNVNFMVDSEVYSDNNEEKSNKNSSNNHIPINNRGKEILGKMFSNNKR